MEPYECKSQRTPTEQMRDEALHDLKKLKLRNWSQIVKDGKAWNDLAQKTRFPNPRRVVV